ncbi:MAG: ATPase AAA [Syntrophaceae bacterium]|nr:MAG: ATPase AAA [Syntrophaceae bacterium]
MRRSTTRRCVRSAICPCRKRRLERGEEPAKKRKEVESEEPEAHEQESEEPEPHEEEAKKRKEDEDDEDSKSEVSLVIAEFDSEEEPDEADPREVEEEEEEREPTVGWVPGPECSCAEPLAAIKQAFDEWIAYNAERKQILQPLRDAYNVARANCMTHRYLLFILSWNSTFVLSKYKPRKHIQSIYLISFS